MKTKMKQQTGHRGPDQSQPADPADPSKTLQDLLARSLGRITELAATKPIPPGSALLAQFSDTKFDLVCVGMDSAARLAREMGVADGYALMSVLSVISGDVPLICTYTGADDHATGVSAVRRN